MGGLTVHLVKSGGSALVILMCMDLILYFYRGGSRYDPGGINIFLLDFYQSVTLIGYF